MINPKEYLANDSTIFAHYKINDMHQLYVLIRPTVHNEDTYKQVRKKLINCRDLSEFINLHIQYKEYFRTIVDLNVFYHEFMTFNINCPYNRVITPQKGGTFVILDFGVEY